MPASIYLTRPLVRTSSTSPAPSSTTTSWALTVRLLPRSSPHPVIARAFQPDPPHSHPLHTDISLAVPICNSLNFLFTALTSHHLGERVDDPWRVALGCGLVLAGVSLCVTSQ